MPFFLCVMIQTSAKQNDDGKHTILTYEPIREQDGFSSDAYSTDFKIRAYGAFLLKNFSQWRNRVQ